MARSNEDAAPESGRSQSWRIFLGALLVIAVCIIGQVGWAHPKDVVEFKDRLVPMLLDAAIIAAIGTMIAETPWFKSQLEERLIRVGVIDRWTHPDALRHFDRNTLRAIESAAQQACLPDPVPQEFAALLNGFGALRDDIHVWRADNIMNLEYIEVSGDASRYELRVTWDGVYVNSSDTAETIQQPFLGSGHLAPGSSDRYSKTTETIEINGEPVNVPAPEHVRENDRESWTTTVPVHLPPDAPKTPRVRLRIVELERYPRHNPWVFTLWRPLHTLDLTVEHPESVMPILYVFGVGGKGVDTDPMKPLPSSSARVKRWKYDGWLLPSHGVVLVFYKA